MKILIFMALICFIGLCIATRIAYYRKPYAECSPDVKNIRIIGAVLCGVCALVMFGIVLLSLLRG